MLSLDSNRIPAFKVDVFKGLNKLKRLYLSSNPISELQTKLFADLEELKYLDISGCNLTHLSPSTFSSNPKLKHFDLARNNFRSLDLGVVQPLEKLSKLILHNNSLACDCKLQALFYWSREKEVTTTLESEGEPTCKGPKELEWGMLEDITCSVEKDISPGESSVSLVGTIVKVVKIVILLSIFLMT
jgi:Leucine-rich repeat (LRR) protein